MATPDVVSGKNAAIGQTNAERLVAALAALAALEDDRPLPMDVVEGQVNVRERLLPGRRCPRRGVGGGARRAAVVPGRELLHRVGNVRFRTMELHAPVFDFVVRQSFLQRRFGIALQGGVDGRMHRVGLGGEALDAVRLGLAA